MTFVSLVQDLFELETLAPTLAETMLVGAFLRRWGGSAAPSSVMEDAVLHPVVNRAHVAVCFVVKSSVLVGAGRRRWVTVTILSLFPDIQCGLYLGLIAGHLRTVPLRFSGF